MAAAAFPTRAAGRRTWQGTPEVFFAKTIDNSRLVKVTDPHRAREMRMFSLALVALFVLVMLYAWQHFSAIEYGYRIEALNAQKNQLTETNRALRLEEASLRDPERIDALARRMGLQTPQAGQVVHMNPDERDFGGPVLAQASTSVFVVSATQ
ncbi:MAG TPA: cell division protein FtsL [Terriglobia bacterium]|nr:cell division protein FtsL [Terriglobia bacterium]